TFFALRDGPRRLNHFAIFPRASVANGRLVRIEFDNGVVDLETRERSQHMFDRLDLRIAFGQRGGAVRLADVFDARLDFRLAVQIDTPEAHARVRRRGQQ